MGYQIRIVATLCTLSGLTVIACLAYQKWRRRRITLPDPNKWEPLGTVDELCIYPLRSGDAYVMHRARCDDFGLIINGIRDRQLVVYSDDPEMMPAWAGPYPKMLQISTFLTAEHTRLHLTAPNTPPLHLDWQRLRQSNADVVVEKQMHGYRQRLTKCDDSAHRWISRYLLGQQKGFCLYVQQRPIMQTSRWRTIDCQYMPILVLHDKSVEDLNNRLHQTQHTVNHRQFRGNIFIASLPDIRAFDEDQWEWLKIGNDMVLHFTAICRRCIVPNIGMDGRRNPNFEPLRTLKSYRLISDKKEPDMGIYFTALNRGFINKGDPVYVQYRPKSCISKLFNIFRKKKNA